MSGFCKFICMKVILLGLFLLFLQPARAQFDWTAMDQYLLKNQKTLGGNLVALVWKDGKIIYQKELGDFNAKTQLAVATSSQWLTAAMVMSVVEQGKLNLDDPVAKYVPIYNKYLKRYITIRHCLSHTTGIEREGRLINKLIERKKFESLEEEVNLIATKDVSNKPAGEFCYSNHGLSMAARVCEIVTKKSFERLMQEKISRPLKMRGTNFTDERGNSPSPTDGATCTANDYLNFLIMMLNKGSFEGKQILTEASVKEMERSQTINLPVKYAPPSASGFSFGLGAWLAEQDDKGNGSVLTCPGQYGTWPYIDNCRKYAAVLFVKNQQFEERNSLGENFRGIIEDILGPCKN